MKRILILLATVMLISCAMASALPTSMQSSSLSQIIEKYAKARGLSNYDNLHSLKIEGIRVRNDVMPVIYYRSRPNHYFMEYDLGDMTGYRVFDGEKAWQTAPWRGLVNPELLPNEQAEMLAKTAEFNDLLVSWEKDGHKIELLEEVTVNDRPQFVIELEFSKTGHKTKYFIDKETYLLTKTQAERTSQGRTLDIETHYSDYQSIGGIMFPFLEVEYINGNKNVTIEYEEIKLNVDLPSDFYSMERYKTE